MTKPESDANGHAGGTEHEELEEYAGGYIKARHGFIPAWLLVVYAALFVFAIYYLIAFWGGVGPGRLLG